MTIPTEEQRERAEWDLLLRDLELRAEQTRQMKAFPTGTYEGWKLAFAGMSAGATLLGAGVALGALIVHLL